MSDHLDHPEIDWVVVIEAGTQSSGESFLFPDIENLVGRLREWHTTGLFNPYRYSLELHIVAPTPYEALRCAAGYHDLAARAVGLRPSLIRAEVLTLGEYETEPLLPSVAGLGEAMDGRAASSSQLYEATRALLRVSTADEITRLLVRFVTSIGGSVNVGRCRTPAGQVCVDISLAANKPLSAVADGASAAGQVIRQSLPFLVADSRAALQHLLEGASETGSPPVPPRL